jgi:dimeric dUTPase (all-alpha-NTP-PPase superfamily)
MTTRVVENYTEYNFVDALQNYTQLSDGEINTLPEFIFDTNIKFNYVGIFLHHALLLRNSVVKKVKNPKFNVDSTVRDPFNRNETYLQHNALIVRFFFTIVTMNFFRGTQTIPTDHQKELIRNLYSHVLNMEHPLIIEDEDIPFMRLFATYIFKLRPKLVNLGEKRYVCDLFSNILSRIHAVIEVSIMIKEQ